MSAPRIVVDTNVWVAAIRSSRGASYRLLRLLGKAEFTICVSVPLVIEYEAALKKSARSAGLTHADVDTIVDYLCRIAEHREIHYLWRPTLPDPGDDMVLEVAVEAEVDALITHNLRDFRGSERFGITVETPQWFLATLEDLP